MEGFLGEIKMFAGSLVPRGWVPCNGADLPIGQYINLHQVIGNIYGGNGRTNFRVPNLSGRAPMGAGLGPGLTQRKLGELPGSESVVMTQSNLPAHSHSAAGKVMSYNNVGNKDTPEGSNIAGSSYDMFSNASADARLAKDNVSVITSNTGGSMPIEVVEPVIAVQFIICVEGEFPHPPSLEKD